MNTVIVIDFKKKEVKGRHQGALDLGDPKHQKHVEDRADAILEADGHPKFVSMYGEQARFSDDPELWFRQEFDGLDFERECSNHLTLLDNPEK